MSVPVRPSVTGDNCLACGGFFMFTGRKFDTEDGKCYNIFQCSPCGRTERWATALEDCPQANLPRPAVDDTVRANIDNIDKV